MAPSYLFDNARPQAGQGFSSIEARLYGLLCGEGLLDVPVLTPGTLISARGRRPG
jgi:hypothetical protein